MLRALTICFLITIACTWGCTHVYADLHKDDPRIYRGSCMSPWSNVEGDTFLCGVFGFLVSCVLGPTTAITDRVLERRRMQFDYQLKAAQNDALTLLRASSVPASQQKLELLRAAQAGPATPPQELLRAVQTEDEA